MQTRFSTIPLITDAIGSSVFGLDTFGHQSRSSGFFKKIRTEPVSGYYALGGGHRIYSSTLKRFIQPDKQSPFTLRELNSYNYCLNDPINREDPSGGWSIFSYIRQVAGFGRKAPKQIHTIASEERGVNRLIAQIIQNGKGHPGTPLQHVDPQASKSFFNMYPAAGYFNRGFSSNSPDFLRKIEKNSHYLFVMTGKKEMFVHPATTMTPFHPGIARSYAGEQPLIAAGQLYKRGSFDFSLTSYAPLYKTEISNLGHPKALLVARGARVRPPQFYWENPD